VNDSDCDSPRPTPEQFEEYVLSWLRAAPAQLKSFHTERRQLLQGLDGEYEIDVAVTLELMEMKFLILVECKRWKNPVKREIVAALHQRMISLGAQKGLIAATSGFQRGAIQFAQAHGIALVNFASASTAWIAKSMNAPKQPPAWTRLPEFIGWLHSLTEDGKIRYSNISARNPEYLRAALWPGNDVA